MVLRQETCLISEFDDTNQISQKGYYKIIKIKKNKKGKGIVSSETTKLGSKRTFR